MLTSVFNTPWYCAIETAIRDYDSVGLYVAVRDAIDTYKVEEQLIITAIKHLVSITGCNLHLLIFTKMAKKIRISKVLIKATTWYDVYIKNNTHIVIGEERADFLLACAHFLRSVKHADLSEKVALFRKLIVELTSSSVSHMIFCEQIRFYYIFREKILEFDEAAPLWKEGLDEEVLKFINLFVGIN
jgi:hypothetical protein